MVSAKKPLVVVGYAPGLKGDGRPLGPGSMSGRRLLDLAGLTYEELTERAVVCNLSRNGGRRASLPAEAITKAAPGAKMLVVGRQTAIDLFGSSMVAFPFCLWSGGGVAIIPHTSGLNRWWNDEGNVAKVRRFLRRTFS